MSDSNLRRPKPTSSEIAALHDAARRRAVRMRNEAIADACAWLVRALAHARVGSLRRLRSLLAGRVAPRRGRPQTV